jgi:hypothetical protein
MIAPIAVLGAGIVIVLIGGAVTAGDGNMIWANVVIVYDNGPPRTWKRSLVVMLFGGVKSQYSVRMRRVMQECCERGGLLVDCSSRRDNSQSWAPTYPNRFPRRQP